MPKEGKDYIWENWIKWFRVPRGTEPDVKNWVMKTANKCFKDCEERLEYPIRAARSKPITKMGHDHTG